MVFDFDPKGFHMANTVRLLANAGVLITINDTKILLDALHHRKTRLFSRVEEQLLYDMVHGKGEFAHIDYLLVTHDHPDHHDNGVAQAFLDHHPETVAVSPTELNGKNAHRLRAEEQRFAFGDVKLKCRRIAHEGQQYADVANYGFLMTVGDETVSAFGDGMSDFEGIKALVGDARVTTAFLNFPFITLLRGKRFVQEVLQPEKIVLFHLPFPEDDANNYIQTAKYILQREKDKLPPCIMLYEHGQCEAF